GADRRAGSGRIRAEDHPRPVQLSLPDGEAAPPEPGRAAPQPRQPPLLRHPPQLPGAHPPGPHLPQTAPAAHRPPRAAPEPPPHTPPPSRPREVTGKLRPSRAGDARGNTCQQLPATLETHHRPHLSPSAPAAGGRWITF